MIVKNNCAFTLIELLVVVLIVAILAAVALPQYQLAVDKARFATLRNLGMSFVNAARIFYVANGSWPENFTELDIDAPADMQPVSNNKIPAKMQCVQNTDNYCCIYAVSGIRSAGVTCGKNDYSFGFAYLLVGISPSQAGYCVADDNVPNSKRLCNSMYNGKQKIGKGGWHLYTPQGQTDTHIYYSIN